MTFEHKWPLVAGAIDFPLHGSALQPRRLQLPRFFYLGQRIKVRRI